MDGLTREQLNLADAILAGFPEVSKTLSQYDLEHSSKFQFTTLKMSRSPLRFLSKGALLKLHKQQVAIFTDLLAKVNIFYNKGTSLAQTADQIEKETIEQQNRHSSKSDKIQVFR
ncbi:MAG: hypothetical protein R2792_15815 [Saprospiraceae bacterium]